MTYLQCIIIIIITLIVLNLFNGSVLQLLAWPCLAVFQQGKNLLMVFIISKLNLLKLNLLY